MHVVSKTPALMNSTARVGDSSMHDDCYFFPVGNAVASNITVQRVKYCGKLFVLIRVVLQQSDCHLLQVA